MSLSMLPSLALMLLLLSSILHFVSLILPAWVQLSVLIPPRTLSLEAEDGGGGEGVGRGGGKLEMENVTSDSVDSSLRGGGQGARGFVSICLGLWEWCGQFRQIAPDCEQPGFVSGVEMMGVVVLFTLPLSLLLLSYCSCLHKDSSKRRLLTRASFVCSAFSGVLLLVAVLLYGLLTRKELDAMFSQIGQHRDRSRAYLGWAFGAEGVTSILAFVATLCLGLHLRSSPKSPQEFQLVV